MDVTILNTNLDAVSIVDTYESFIWTDRYYAYGDFELYEAMREGLLDYIKQDYYLQSKESEHVMIVEKIQITSDTEDGNHVTVTGRSLESILDRRIVWGQKLLSGNLQNGIKTLLNENVISPSDSNRKIPNFIGLAHDRIMYLGMSYIDRGCVTQDEYENLRVYLYEPYERMGGNGSAKRIMQEVDKLPIHKFIEKEEEHNEHE